MVEGSVSEMSSQGGSSMRGGSFHTVVLHQHRNPLDMPGDPVLRLRLGEEFRFVRLVCGFDEALEPIVCGQVDATDPPVGRAQKQCERPLGSMM